MKKFFRNNGLSITFFISFLFSLAGQVVTGLKEHNNETIDMGGQPIGFIEYLRSGHFLQATFENWESEFLQMALFLVLSMFLLSLVIHWRRSLKDYNEEQLLKNQPTETSLQYLSNLRFWFESFQNRQSEFLSIFSIIVLSIFLRAQYSLQSKPVDAPDSETGG